MVLPATAASWRVCQSYNSLPHWPRPECLPRRCPSLEVLGSVSVNGNAAIGTHIQEKSDTPGCQHRSRDGGQNTRDCQTLWVWWCHLVPFHTPSNLPHRWASPSECLPLELVSAASICGFQARPATEIEFARSLGKPPSNPLIKIRLLNCMPAHEPCTRLCDLLVCRRPLYQ